MINYTLLPHKEMRTLRREYRVRLFITFSFFASCTLLAGMIFLLPSYMASRAQAEALEGQAKRMEQQDPSGIGKIEKDLKQSQTIAKKVLEDKNQISFSDSVRRVTMHRPENISISALEITQTAVGTSTLYQATIQGKAATREALLEFKKNLESDAVFSMVDLPLSDLAKSVNSEFTLKLNINVQKR